MVAQFLRLKLTLLANSFRRKPLQAVGLALVLLYGIALGIAAVIGLISLRFTTPDIARAVVVSLGSVVVLGFLVLPLIFGADDAIDPRRFALFGIRATPLSTGVAAAAFVSVPSLAVAVLAVAQIVTWSRGPLPVLVAVVAAALLVPTCVLASRVSTAVASLFLSSRRARDVSGVALVFLIALLAPAAALLTAVDWESRVLPVLRRIAAVAGWTPFGAVWSAPADAANDSIGPALAKLGIAAGFVIVLALLWRMLVSVALARREREAKARRYSGLGWFQTMPGTPFGVIAARSLSYWGRDARYRVAVWAIPVVPIIAVAALLLVGVSPEFIGWLPVPLMCLFLGWTVHNDVAYDSSAFWAHVSSDTRGTDDRWGRLVPPLLIGIPLVLIGSALTVLITGAWDTLPALIGLSACALLVTLGVSSVASAAFPYPAVHPGDSPFAQPQAAGSSGSVVQSLSLLISVALALPVVGVVIAGALLDPVWFLVALPVGLVVGIGVLVGGVSWGGSIVDRRAPELLAFTLQN